MSSGAQPHEQVGKLADGRQVLLTTRFGPWRAKAATTRN
jgi:hypothetical protein